MLGALGTFEKGTDAKSLRHKLVKLPYLSESVPSYSQRTPRFRVNRAPTFQSSWKNELMFLR